MLDDTFTLKDLNKLKQNGRVGISNKYQNDKNLNRYTTQHYA
jgi:hypothetical protein